MWHIFKPSFVLVTTPGNLLRVRRCPAHQLLSIEASDHDTDWGKFRVLPYLGATVPRESWRTREGTDLSPRQDR